MPNQLPYHHVFYHLLEGILKALKYCFEIDNSIDSERIKKESKAIYNSIVKSIKFQNSKNKIQKKPPDWSAFLELCMTLSENNILLHNCFNYFKDEGIQKPGINRHLYNGLLKSHQEDGIYSRLVKLTLEAYKNSQRIRTDPKSQGRVLPSPLYILYYALIIPEEPQSAAYALAICRGMLFKMIGCHPEHPDLEYFNTLESFNEYDIHSAMYSFRRNVKIQAGWPRDDDKSRINWIVGHTLSMKGITHLWFNGEKNLLEFCSLPSNQTEIDFVNKFSDPNYKFKISYFQTDLPDSGEIVNILFGIPVPIRGADILFYGGIKKTSDSNLIISLSGEPGVGKTSIALSLAALFYPFNTTTVYISLEENPKDLRKRLFTLIPDYFKEVEFNPEKNKAFQKKINSEEWFRVHQFNVNYKIEEFTQVLESLNNKIEYNSLNPDNSVPAICPLYVVIDNINELIEGYQESEDYFSKLEEFIKTCRRLKAIVILISAGDVPKKVKLEYLIDIAMRVKYSDTEKIDEKPVRVLQLTKTRHQASRAGSHVFHLSGPSGFRISPQIPSQMDRREKLRQVIPDEANLIHALNFIEREDTLKRIFVEKIVNDIEGEKPFLSIYPNTQILIHGYGSSGKAGLALKILLTPIISSSIGLAELEKELNQKRNDQKTLTFGEFKHRRKILVISFLYSEEYYKELVVKEITPRLTKLYHGLKKPIINIHTFYPGYLQPEDMINKITRLLDDGNLEGEPYTGVLLDGMHNVFLQFKKIQENDMVWPLLYSILSRYSLTIVSTFTNFSLNDKLIEDDVNDRNMMVAQSIPDHILMQQGQTPFMHTLVKASDYYLVLEEKFNKSYKREYHLAVKSSIKQTPSKKVLEWNRKSAFFKRVITDDDFSKAIKPLNDVSELNKSITELIDVVRAIIKSK